MTELFNILRDHKSNDSLMRDLGQHSQLQTLEDARAAYDSALTAVEAAVTDSTKAATTIEELLSTARAFKWADRNEPTRLFSGSEQLIGEQLTATIFGERQTAVQTYLAGETGISTDSAAEVLQIVSTVSIATAVGSPDEDVDLATRLDPASAAGGAGAAGSAAPNLPSPSYRGAAPQADGSGGRQDSGDVTEVDPAGTGGELQERQRRIALLTASVVAIAAMFFIIGNGSDDEPTETLAATDSTETADGTDTETEVAIGDDETATTEVPSGDDQPGESEIVGDSTEGSEDNEGITASSIVTYNVPMIDIVTPDRPATGLLSFDFNTETGEVCYAVISTDIEGPYRTHIHVGGLNEKGGIVVDMGPQVNGATGCLDNPPADISNILADLENHYAELHDVSEEWTIRGQLSEAFGEGEIEQFELTFDPDAGGAYLAIEAGIISLRGEVPDLLTATTLSRLYSPAGSGIVVNNELSVVPGAPIPSGRILLGGDEFTANSSDLPAVDSSTESALVSLLSAQDGWKLTAVGRTDSDGSELNNLELSLRRAKSLRTYVEGLNTFDGSILVRGAGDLGAQGRHLELEFLPGQ